jgi:hypothetical protein
LKRRASVASLLAVLLVTAYVSTAEAQTVSGSLFEDRDADGIHDAGEPPLEGLAVRLFGTTDSGSSVDETVVTGADGAFAFTPGPGCYLLAPQEPPGLRLVEPRSDGVPETEPGYLFPVGLPRPSKLDQAVANLEAGSFRYSALGDSIAANFNLLCGGSSFFYSQQLRSRLVCVAPSADIAPIDAAAQLGEHTDDLLVDESENLNNVFRVVEAQPQLVTLSIIGNDLLDVDPGDGATQEQINAAVAEVLDARSNLQEVLSGFVSEIPDADVVLNTLYDNEAYACAPSGFHSSWIPIVNRILREVAWGQSRRVGIAEVAAEFAKLDQTGGCTGFEDRICLTLFDRIHPTGAGYEIIAEKLWESSGGVRLGPQDALARDSFEGADFGYLRRVRRLFPSRWEVRGGAVVGTPEAALDGDDGGLAASIRLGNGDEELRLSGFPDWFDELRVSRAVVGVRYRTTGPGTPVDDLYRMEASLDGGFRPAPGHAYTPTDWNFFTPIVGAGGPSQPPEGPDYPDAETLVVPEVAQYREVSATLGKNPVLEPGAPEYAWPAPTHADLATTVVRVVSAPEPGAMGDDDYLVELDAAWIDLYGWETERPAEIVGLRVDRATDGALELSFEALAGADRYNVYRGRIGSLPSSGYDHGAAAPGEPLCDTSVQDAGGGRLVTSVAAAQQAAESVYFLVTAHVGDVETPAGFASGGVEIDRSQAVCR